MKCIGNKIVPIFRVDNTFLIHDLVDPERNLYVSKDFGATYSMVSSYTKSFFLREDAQKDRTEIFLQRMVPGSDKTTILSSPNYFERNRDTKVLYSNAIDFQIKGDTILVPPLSRNNLLHLAKGFF